MEQRYAYVARKGCGCVQAVYAERAVEEKVLGKAIGDWICGGLTVQREEVTDLGIPVVVCHCFDPKPERTLFDGLEDDPEKKPVDLSGVIRIGTGTVIPADLDVLTGLNYIENARLKPGFASLEDPAGGEDLVIYVGEYPCPVDIIGLLCPECLHAEAFGDDSPSVCPECDRALAYAVPASAGVHLFDDDPFAVA